MKVKKVPMRTCVVTHEKCEKKDLLRIVRNNIGELFVDETGKQNGRGAYIKKDNDVLEQAKKSRVLERSLNTSIPDEFYEEVKKHIK